MILKIVSVLVKIKNSRMSSKRVFRPSGKGFYEVTGVNEDTPVDATALGAQAFVYDFTYFVPEKLQTLIKENDGVLDLGG